LRRWDPGLRDEAEAEPGLHLEGSWDSGAEEPMGCFRGVGGWDGGNMWGSRGGDRGREIGLGPKITKVLLTSLHGDGT